MRADPALQATAWLIAIAFVVWSGSWTLVALWKAARREQLGWYLACTLLGFAGLLPMIYVFMVAPHVPESPPSGYV